MRVIHQKIGIAEFTKPKENPPPTSVRCICGRYKYMRVGYHRLKCYFGIWHKWIP